MGNQQAVSHSHTKSNISFPKLNLKPIKSTDKKPKFPTTNTSSKSSSNDHFFIKHIHNHRNEIDIRSLDQRRQVYISLTGLYQTWKRIPHIALYSALFILPLKKDWISHNKNIKDFQSNPLANLSIFSDATETREFVQLLKWKHSQGLILFMSDYEDSHNTSNNNSLINSFWYELNDKLCSLWDPITNTSYEPLIFDINWWQNQKTFISKYETKTSSILSELYFLKMKYNTISEIIHQSNPNSLEVIKSYPNTQIICNENNLYMDDCDNENECDEKDENEGNWFVCDYDPNDITEHQIDCHFDD